MLCFHAVKDEDGHFLEDEDESGMGLCTCWSKIFQSRNEEERHHAHETILEYVQKAPDDIRWEIDKREFDGMMATKKESAPGLDGIPCTIYRGAGGLGSQFLFDAYKRVLEGGVVPAHFGASRTVVIPKSSDVDDNGLMVKSPEELRSLTLCEIVIARFLPRRFTVACIGTSSDACTGLRDASRPIT